MFAGFEWADQHENIEAGTDRIEMDSGKRSRIALTLAIALVLAACARRQISPPPLDPVPMARETYVIGVGDTLRITGWKNGEVSLSGRCS